MGDKYINSNGDVWNAQSRSTLLNLGSPTITVSPSDGTATLTLTATQAANIFEDDYLSVTSFSGEENDRARTPVTLREMGIGRVRSVVGTTVTLEGVPLSLTTGTYTLKHCRMPKYTAPTFGDVTSGSNVVTNINITTGWQGGDMISTPFNAGWIPVGARVTAVNSGTKEITLSNNASGSATSAYIADGVLSLLHASSAGAPTSTQYMSGCFVKAEYNRAVDANGMVLDGWLCLVGGMSPVWEPVYLSVVSPAN